MSIDEYLTAATKALRSARDAQALSAARERWIDTADFEALPGFIKDDLRELFLRERDRVWGSGG